MKQLILVRHADANKSLSTSDYNAPLSLIGVKQAHSAGDFISHKKIDKILVSPAKRTVDTLSIMLESNNEIDNIESLRDLYDSSYIKTLEHISEQDDAVNTLMIVGHNPVIFQLALQLSSANCEHYSAIEEFGMSTAQIVVIEFPDLKKWSLIKLSSGVITKLFNPNAEDWIS